MRTKIWILLVIILIIATFFRAYHFKTTPPGLYPDEAMDGTNAEQALQTHQFKVFYPENNGREGLFMNIQAVFLRFFGVDEPWVLRLPSAIFGILTVLGLFFLAKELFRRDDLALLATFLIAVSFWHIMFSRIGFRAIMAPFFLVWASFFFLAAIRRGSASLATIGGLFFGLGFYSYIAYRVAPLMFLLLVPFFQKTKNFWKITAIFLVVTFIVGAPIGWYYLRHPADFFGRTTQVSIFSGGHPLQDLALNTIKTIGMLDIHGDWNWRQNFAGAPELFWPVGLLFWLGVILGVWEIIKNKEKLRGAYVFLFGWLILAVLPVVFSNEGIPHALRSILMIPPIFILAAAGGAWLWRNYIRRLSRQAAVSLAIIFCVVLIGQAYYEYFIAWANNPNVPGAFNADYVAIGEIIKGLPAAAPKYVVVAAGGVPVPVEQPDGQVKQIPMPAQTVMFLTNSFTAAGQAAANIHYLLPGEESQIPSGAQVFYIR